MYADEISKMGAELFSKITFIGFPIATFLWKRRDIYHSRTMHFKIYPNSVRIRCLTIAVDCVILFVPFLFMELSIVIVRQIPRFRWPQCIRIWLWLYLRQHPHAPDHIGRIYTNRALMLSILRFGDIKVASSSCRLLHCFIKLLYYSIRIRWFLSFTSPEFIWNFLLNERATKGFITRWQFTVQFVVWYIDWLTRWLPL